jgi:hypothetical protein
MFRQLPFLARTRETVADEVTARAADDFMTADSYLAKAMKKGLL